MVFQDELLFPHLTALENVAFGPRSRGVAPPRRRARRARAWLARLGVERPRRPPAPRSCPAARRSGSRSPGRWPPSPRLLLLDEPLVRPRRRASRWRCGSSSPGTSPTSTGSRVLVTHDALDAMTVANRVVVHRRRPGRAGRHPRRGRPRGRATDHVARLVGLNVLPRHQRRHVDPAAPTAPRWSPARRRAGEVSACFSPSAVTLTVGEPHGSARNRWPGTVTSVAPHGVGGAGARRRRPPG